MDKKTVPIAGLITPRRKGHIRTKFAIDALAVEGNFKTIHEKSTEKKLSGRNTYTNDKRSIIFQRNTRRVKTGFGNVSRAYW
jgi:hypothetical protein